MAKPPKPHSGSAANYPVGYGKPPKASQFRKGQSGNPGGASKKVRARKADRNGSPFDQIMLDEIGRPVAITENGKRTKIPTSRAIGRSLMIDAVKGNRSAQKLAIAGVQAAYDRRQAATTERFGLLVQYHTSQVSVRNGPTAPADAGLWPHPSDVELDYRNCTGRVIGPIDPQQAQPFFALVAEYRVWQARLGQLETMANPSGGDMHELYVSAVSAITCLLSATRNHLPPSFKEKLDWDDGEIPARALDIDGLNDGETVNLALLPPESDDIVYGLYQLCSGAMDASAEIRDRTKLNFDANTTSLINRLQTERQNREGGAAPAPTVPNFDDFYDGFAAEGRSSVDEMVP